MAYPGVGTAGSGIGIVLTGPCILGPAELCRIAVPLIETCDAGDARDCLALGQFLADTPPRALIAISFFEQACRIGDPEGCERFYRIQAPSNASCESDLFACGWRAMRAKDKVRLDEACSLGVSDACSFMLIYAEGDPEQSLAYLEKVCQAGMPAACEELARSLRPGCVEGDESRHCYPPDPAQAKAALEIACSAGQTEACKQL